MLAGMISAMATNTSSFLPEFRNTIPAGPGIALIGATAAVCLLLVFISHQLSLAKAARAADDKAMNMVLLIFTLFAEFWFGLSFSIALSVANMTKLSATISFLDLRYWNPALAFVMMAAIPLAAVSFHHIFQRDLPLLEVKFVRPSLNDIDKKLVWGATVFGVGWG
jgi:hypothetical protein